MLGIALLLGGAAIGYAIARALNVPPVPLLLVAGIAVARTGLLEAATIEDTLILGLTFLLFVTGIDLSPQRARAQRSAAVRVGLFQFVALGGAGLAAALALGFDPLSAGYLALALTASSTLVVVRLLRMRQQMFEPFGRLVVGVLLLQNLLVILAIPILTFLPSGGLSVAAGLIGTLSLIGASYVVHRRVAPRLLRLDGENDALLLATLAVLFLFIGTADLLRLPLVTGAFLAGVALSGFPVDGVVRSQLRSIGDFFVAIFFTALGAIVRIPSGIELLQGVALAAVVVLATPPLVAAIAERTGLSARPGIEAGLLLAQTSELSLVVGLYGLMAGQVGADVFTVIALVTVVTMVLTPFITTTRATWMLLRLHPLRRRLRTPVPTTGHVLVLGAGSTGMPLVETLLTSGREVVVADDDPTVIAHLRDADVPCIRGDASDTDVLRAANARGARMIISTIRRPGDNRRLLEFAHGVPALIRVFDDADAEWVQRLGGTPILYSRAAARRMLEWFEEAFPHDGATRAPADARSAIGRDGPAEPGADGRRRGK